MRKVYILNLVNLFSIMLSQIFIVPFMIKYLGVHQYERWLFVVSLNGIFSLSFLGVDVFSTNQARMSFSKKNDESAEIAIRNSNVILVYTIIFFAILCFFAFLLGFDKSVVLMIFLGPILSYRAYLSYIMTAKFSQSWELVTFIVYNTVLAICISLAAWAGFSVFRIASVMGAVMVFAGIVPLLFFIKWKAPSIPLMPGRSDVRSILQTYRDALPIFSYTASNIALTHIPILILTSLPGIEEGGAAAFAISRTMVGIVRLLCQQISRSNGIEISRRLGDRDPERASNMILHGAAVTGLLAALGLGGLLPVADLVVRIWTQRVDLYRPDIILAFCCGGVLSAQIQLPMILPQFTNRAQLVLKPMIWQIALLIMLGVGAALLWGGLGLVIALFVSELGTLGVVALRKILPSYGIGPLTYLRWTLLPAALAALFSAAGSLVAREVVKPTTVGEVAIAGGVWGVIVVPVAMFAVIWVVRRQKEARRGGVWGF